MSLDMTLTTNPKHINVAGYERSNALVHYGSSKFNPNKFTPIKNDSWNKPIGGLWTSPQDTKYGWKQWNESSGYKTCDENNSFTILLKKDAKIFVIDSYEDLKNAPLRETVYNKVLRNTFYSKILDFQEIAENYDAIWLTDKGQQQTHTSSPLNLYGWDCESVLLLNTQCIEK